LIAGQKTQASSTASGMSRKSQTTAGTRVIRRPFPERTSGRAGGTGGVPGAGAGGRSTAAALVVPVTG
jgi:hypothetical protein